MATVVHHLVRVVLAGGIQVPRLLTSTHVATRKPIAEVDRRALMLISIVFEV